MLRENGAYIRGHNVCPASMLNHPPAPALTFTQFVSCLINQASSKVTSLTQFGAGENLDIHWRPQTLLCNFCMADFNIIGHLEHMDEDVSCAVKQLKLKNVTSVHDNVSQNNHSISHWYNQLNSTLRLRLSELYSHDFRLLQYSDKAPTE